MAHSRATNARPDSVDTAALEKAWSRGLLFFEIEVCPSRRIFGPQLLDALVWLTIIFNGLEILDNFQWRADSVRVVKKFILGRGPWGILQGGG